MPLARVIRMKYIVLEVNNKGIIRELPVIFPEIMSHADMFKYMQRQMTIQHHADSVRCISAGFISSIAVGTAGGCSGKSESLEIASRGEDDKLIQMLDYTHGIRL